MTVSVSTVSYEPKMIPLNQIAHDSNIFTLVESRHNFISFPTVITNFHSIKLIRV